MQALLLHLEGGQPASRPMLARIDALSRHYLGDRPVSHLTPRYVLDRTRVWWHQRQYADAPWLTADAIAILSTALRESDNGVEWGSGRSTTWLARRTRSLLSVESDPAWSERVSETIARLRLSNVVYKHVPANQEIVGDPHKKAYIEADAGLTPGSLDYALVDGWYRAECALRAVDLLKPGGLLIVDNAQEFLPHPTRSPWFAVTTTLGPTWARFAPRVASWRYIRTNNGVWDTAIWIKTLAEEH